jgi:hypothetical protein
MRVNARQPPYLVLWLGALQRELLAIGHEPRSDGCEEKWQVRRWPILSARRLQVLWQSRATFQMPTLLKAHGVVDDDDPAGLEPFAQGSGLTSTIFATRRG